MMEMLPLTELWLSLLLAVGILLYLIYALLKPEDF
ncbi:K(+)-transporting ATPase subunit F [Phascolarctobacterium sp.]